jgi:hypothetical protein
MEWDTITGLSCAAAADIMIAGSMVYLLRSRRTAFAQSRTLVNKLILYSVETGLLTSIWALVIVITFATMPHNLIALGMLFILPKRKLHPGSTLVLNVNVDILFSLCKFVDGDAQLERELA